MEQACYGAGLLWHMPGGARRAARDLRSGRKFDGRGAPAHALIYHNLGILDVCLFVCYDFSRRPPLKVDQKDSVTNARG